MNPLSKILTVLVLLMGAQFSAVQAQDTLRKSIYFAYNRSELQQEAEDQLDSLVASLAEKHIVSVRITGNTDTRGSQRYNQVLSDKRAASVFEYLENKGIASESLEILGQGKTLPNFEGSGESDHAGNRRTDIEIIAYPAHPDQFIATNYGLVNVADENVAQHLKFPNGILVNVEPGSFGTLPNSLVSLNPVLQLSADKMFKEGYTTMTSEGEVLSSAGILCLGITPKRSGIDPDSINLTKPVEVWVPVRNCLCVPSRVSLWDPCPDSNGNIRWVRNNSAVRIVEEGRMKYYVFNTTSDQCINLDCLQPTKLKTIVFRKYRPGSVTLVYNKARTIITGKPGKPGTFVVPFLLTKEEPRIFATAYDGNKQLFLNGRRLSHIKKNLLTGDYILKGSQFRHNNPMKLKSVNKSEVIFGYVEP